MANLTTVSSFVTFTLASPTKKSEGVFAGKFGVADNVGFRTRWTRLGGRIGFIGGVTGCCAANRVEANKSISKELIIFMVLSLALG